MSPRVRVTSPQTRLALRRHRSNSRQVPLTPAVLDLAAAETALRRQRRHAMRTVALLGAILTVLLIACIAIQGRLGWAVLFFLPYPLLLALAAYHVRRAERIESES